MTGSPPVNIRTCDNDLIPSPPTFTRECLAIEMYTSLSGPRVGRALNWIIHERASQKVIVTDNGLEFLSPASDQWCYQRGPGTNSSSRAMPCRTASAIVSRGGFRMNASASVGFKASRKPDGSPKPGNTITIATEPAVPSANEPQRNPFQPLTPTTPGLGVGRTSDFHASG